MKRDGVKCATAGVRLAGVLNAHASPSHLNKYLPQGDEGSAKLRQKQAADEEIPLVLSGELRNRQREHKQSEQTNTGMEQNTQPTLEDNSWNSSGGERL